MSQEIPEHVHDAPVDESRLVAVGSFSPTLTEWSWYSSDGLDYRTVGPDDHGWHVDAAIDDAGEVYYRVNSSRWFHTGQRATREGALSLAESIVVQHYEARSRRRADEKEAEYKAEEPARRARAEREAEERRLHERTRMKRKATVWLLALGAVAVVLGYLAL